jgi:hypothetical protein
MSARKSARKSSAKTSLKAGWESAKESTNNLLFDNECPMASAMVWGGFFMAFYYGLAMPSDRITKAENKIKVKSTKGHVKWILSVVWFLGGLLASRVIKAQCRGSGNSLGQSLVWGVIAFIALGIISALVLAVTQDSWSVSTASEFVNYLNRPNDDNN